MYHVRLRGVRVRRGLFESSFPGARYRIGIKLTLSDINKKILKRIEAKKERLSKLRPLPQAALKRLKSELAIEGNTLLPMVHATFISDTYLLFQTISSVHERL
jgi:hypothetical protein